MLQNIFAVLNRNGCPKFSGKRSLRLSSSPPFRISRHIGFPFLWHHVALETVAAETGRHLISLSTKASFADRNIVIRCQRERLVVLSGKKAALLRLPLTVGAFHFLLLAVKKNATEVAEQLWQRSACYLLRVESRCVPVCDGLFSTSRS